MTLQAFCIACGQPLTNPLDETHMTPECLEPYFRIRAARAAASGKANESNYLGLADGIAAGRLAEAKLAAAMDAEAAGK